MVYDLVNGTFEILGAGAIGLSIHKVLKDRQVKGISWIHVAFFTTWSVWDVLLYWLLDLPVSLAAGIVIAVAGLVYVTLVLHFKGNGTKLSLLER